MVVYLISFGCVVFSVLCLVVILVVIRVLRYLGMSLLFGRCVFVVYSIVFVCVWESDSISWLGLRLRLLRIVLCIFCLFVILCYYVLFIVSSMCWCLFEVMMVSVVSLNGWCVFLDCF